MSNQQGPTLALRLAKAPRSTANGHILPLRQAKNPSQLLMRLSCLLKKRTTRLESSPPLGSGAGTNLSWHGLPQCAKAPERKLVTVERFFFWRGGRGGLEAFQDKFPASTPCGQKKNNREVKRGRLRQNLECGSQTSEHDAMGCLRHPEIVPAEKTWEGSQKLA